MKCPKKKCWIFLFSGWFSMSDYNTVTILGHLSIQTVKEKESIAQRFYGFLFLFLLSFNQNSKTVYNFLWQIYSFWFKWQFVFLIGLKEIWWSVSLYQLINSVILIIELFSSKWRRKNKWEVNAKKENSILKYVQTCLVMKGTHTHSARAYTVSMTVKKRLWYYNRSMCMRASVCVFVSF